VALVNGKTHYCEQDNHYARANRDFLPRLHGLIIPPKLLRHTTNARGERGCAAAAAVCFAEAAMTSTLQSAVHVIKYVSVDTKVPAPS
jgi:hypothetical protein